MSENHIIIGLGGTGGKVIRSYREQIIDKYGRIDGLDQLKNIRFLYIDSSEVEINEDWIYQGKKIKLGGDDLQLLKAGDLNRRLKDSSTRQDWLGNDDDWRGIKEENTSGMAGNQLRRLGRVNLIPSINEIIEKVSVKHNELSTNTTDFGTTIHIIVGLAGGTGSGSIVDITAQLCRQFEGERNSTNIILYLVLPEIKVFNDKKGQFNDISYLKINGYAALKELNALSNGIFKPYDIKTKNRRIDTDNRFKSAYIISEKNNNGMKFNSVTAPLASLLFLKTITSQKQQVQKGADGNDDRTLPGILNTVDTKENNLNTSWQYWDLSANFRVPGIFKIAVPKVQIRETFAHLLVLNAFNKLLFKNREKQDTGKGYIGEPNNELTSKAENEKITIIQNLRSALMDEWYLTYPYLILDEPMVEAEKRGLIRKGFDDYSFEYAWERQEIKVYKLLTSTKSYSGKPINDKELLKYLKIGVTEYFVRNYKGVGYETFYTNKQTVLSQYAKFLAERIHDKMFGRDHGKQSIWYPLQSYIDILLIVQQEYLDAFEKDLKNKQQTYTKEVAKLETELKNINEVFIGTFSLFGSSIKREKYIERYRDTLKKYWSLTVQLKGINFALQLSQSHLKRELGIIREKIEDDVRAIELRRDKLQNEYLLEKDHILGNINTDGFKSVSNEEGFAKFSKEFFKDASLSDSFIEPLEYLILDNLDLVLKSPDILSNKKLPIMQAAYDVVDKILEPDQILKLTGEDDNFYNANILQVLFKKYRTANNPDLIQLISDMDKRSSPMVSNLVREKGYGIYRTNLNKIAILPDLPGSKEFEAEQLKEFVSDLTSFLKNLPDVKVQSIPGHDISNELTFVQFAWPIRTDAFDNIIDLKRDYDENKDKPQMLFLAHTEDCSDLAELIPPQTGDEMKDALLPYLYAISESEGGFKVNPQLLYGKGGTDELFWQLKSYDGDIDDLSKAHALDPTKLITLKFEVNNIIDFIKVDYKQLDKANSAAGAGITFFTHALVLGAVKKEALKLLDIHSNSERVLSSFENFLDEYLKSIQNNSSDKIYIRLSKAYRYLYSFIKKSNQ